jgi:hypothetical protein
VKKSMISQWDQVVHRHAPRVEISITGNNREYQGIFAKKLFRPQQYQCVGFQKYA